MMSPEDYNEEHDKLLQQILNDKPDVLSFLKTVFGMLYRRTNFYDSTENSSNLRENLTLLALKHFEQNSYELFPAELTPEPINEVEIYAEEDDSSEDSSDNDKLLINKKQKSVKTATASSPSNKYFDFQPNEYYNGSKFDTYCWSQTINDLEIHIRLPKHIKNSKSLKIESISDFIRVQEIQNNHILFQGRMYSKCKTDIVWSVSGEILQINLDKATEVWWKKFLLKEPEINLRNIDCSRNIEEFPEENQLTFEKIRYDQQQKMMGLPTSNEEENLKILHNAWNLDGSPFKGQPFNPSLVKFD